MKTVTRLREVNHRYKETVALENIDLEIPAGRMVGIIGPDGVGKSSLLGLSTGVRRIQDGNIEVLGGDISSARHRAEVCPRIAYMPQGLGKNLYFTLSVYENLDFFGRLFGHPQEQRERRMARLLESTGLAPFRDRPAGKLSGGMKQKLGLCCALIHDPDLLVLDEPTTGVDPLSRRQFWSLIKRIRQEREGMSVIVSTAYMEEARDFDWLIAMDAGRILATGTPTELMASTGTPDLDAAFIELLPEAKRAEHRDLVVPPRPADVPAVTAIRAEGLTRRFGDFTAVDRVDFEIERGEIFGFLGSNGCGKTTTMKMLTALLPASEGQAWLFGEPVDTQNLETRKRVGFMSQAFSLYTELSVWQNLALHARLFHLPEERIDGRVEELITRFELEAYRNDLAASLPLGIRQRLSLAVAIIHEPEILILDEPTSGVDPVARDSFWEMLISLSRNQGVTIFVSTHFMNEAERCDRISLMHAGRVLASDTPAALIAARGVDTLEQTFVAYLEDAAAQAESAAQSTPAKAPTATTSDDQRPAHGTGLMRLLAYARRETLEILRDPVLLTFSLLGSAILMFVLGFGISFDVEDIAYAVLDRDRTPASRTYIETFAGSRYFVERPPLHSDIEADRRMRAGELSLVIEIPPGFGKDLKRGRTPEISAWVDGTMPFRAETAGGYTQGAHYNYLVELARATTGTEPRTTAADLQVRYRYNQDFKSLYAVAPAVIPIMLVLVPAILTAVAVVREKELGSITNLYATPVTRLEFLLGKQMPYVVISMVNYFCLVALAVWFFDVPLKGSLLVLSVGALLYIATTTGFGLLMSTFTRTQIAALFGTSIATMLPATQFSGLTNPVSSLEGAAATIGEIFPTTYFMVISRGVFTKALGLEELSGHLIVLAVSVPVPILLSLLLLKRQED